MIFLALALGFSIYDADLMDEENQNPRRYKWPWFVLAAVLLSIVLAVAWVSFAVKKVERERNFNTSIPAGAK